MSKKILVIKNFDITEFCAENNLPMVQLTIDKTYTTINMQQLVDMTAILMKYLNIKQNLNEGLITDLKSDIEILKHQNKDKITIISALLVAIERIWEMDSE